MLQIITLKIERTKKSIKLFIEKSFEIEDPIDWFYFLCYRNVKLMLMPQRNFSYLHLT